MQAFLFTLHSTLFLHSLPLSLFWTLSTDKSSLHPLFLHSLPVTHSPSFFFQLSPPFLHLSPSLVVFFTETSSLSSLYSTPSLPPTRSISYLGGQCLLTSRFPPTTLLEKTEYLQILCGCGLTLDLVQASRVPSVDDCIAVYTSVQILALTHNTSIDSAAVCYVCKSHSQQVGVGSGIACGEVVIVSYLRITPLLILGVPGELCHCCIVLY